MTASRGSNEKQVSGLFFPWNGGWVGRQPSTMRCAYRLLVLISTILSFCQPFSFKVSLLYPYSRPHSTRSNSSSYLPSHFTLSVAGDDSCPQSQLKLRIQLQYQPGLPFDEPRRCRTSYFITITWLKGTARWQRSKGRELEQREGCCAAAPS